MSVLDVEQVNYWQSLGEIRLKVRVGLKKYDVWAVEFELVISGFEFFIQKDLSARIKWVEQEVQQQGKFSQKLIENGVDFYRFLVTVQVGDQSDTVEYEVLKKTLQRLYPWQQVQLAQIYGNSLIEWDVEQV